MRVHLFADVSDHHATAVLASGPASLSAPPVTARRLACLLLAESAAPPPPPPPPPPLPPPADCPGLHACAQCGARFRNEGSLQHHVKVHQGRTVCPVCHVTYNRVHYLRTHMATQHGMTVEEAKRLLSAVHAQVAPPPPPQQQGWPGAGAVGDGGGALDSGI